jgi:putative ABC transport system permease protein
MENLLQDIRYGVRMLTKRPAFTFVAALSLALGIGANTTIFTVINGLLLTPIPVHDASTLGMVFMTDSASGAIAGFGGYLPMSFPNYEDIRDQNDVFEQMTAVSFGGGILSGEDEPIQLPGFMVTHEYFDVLGVEPARGRFFRPEEDENPGTHYVAVVSYGLWERQFGADEGIVGSTMNINGVPFTVVGVAPEGFTGTLQGFQPDLIWTPFMTYPTLLPVNFRDWPENRRAGLMTSVIGRLKPGVSHEAANTAVKTIAVRLEDQYPEVNSNRSADVTEFTQLFNPTAQGAASAMGGVLMGIVGLVLLIACANVANLLLARAATREKEISVRLALGAGRHRLVRQLLTESILLAMLGAGLGLIFAFWARDLIAGVAPGLLGGGIPLDMEMALDGRVLGFTFAIALVTGILFVLAPALQSSSPQLSRALHEGGRGGSSGGRQQLLRSGLVVGEIALALVALISAGLFIRNMQAAQQLDPGFETYELATIGLNPAGIGYEQGRAEQLFDELMEATTAMGRVKSVAIASSPPLGFGAARTFIPEGWDDTEGKYTATTTVSPGYFETLGVPLLQGRDFTAFDDADSRPVAIINEATKLMFWPDDDAVGKRFHYITEEIGEIEVIGVVADVVSQIGQPVQAISYTPAKQRFQGFMALHMRTDGDPEPVLTEVQALIRKIDRDMPTANPSTIEQTLANALQQSRVIAGMLGTLGGLGLVLALIGTYGLMSYSVNQRSREIGIRVALGAQGNDVMRLVIWHGMVLVGIGIALGVVLSFGATRLFATLLFGVSTTDAVTFVGVPAMLMLVGLIASYLPARRVLRVDPVTALRNE